jgi:RNA polymerase sigma-70 factor (ECF subfamily)
MTDPAETRGVRTDGGTGAAAPFAGEHEFTSAVRAAQGGDEEAFRALYRAVQPRLLRYLRALVGDDAEDVASEAWLQISRDLGSFSGDFDGFRGWASTVARHRATDHLRRERRRPDTTTPFEYLLDLPGAHDTAGGALDAVSTDAAIALIASLPRDQAEAVLLRVVMGLDSERAGQVLGKRAGAVRTAAYRGLHTLAKRLDETGAVPPRGRVPQAGGAVSQGDRGSPRNPGGRRRTAQSRGAAPEQWTGPPESTGKGGPAPPGK